MIDFYETQIKYHQDLINVHTNYIINIKKLISNIKNTDTDSSNICDEAYFNNLNNETLNKMIEPEINELDDTDNSIDNSISISQSYTDGQDMIRDRINNAHIKYNITNGIKEIKTSQTESNNVEIVNINNKKIENSNKQVDMDKPGIISEQNRTDSDNNNINNTIINKFSKYSSIKKLEILSSLFKTAKLNINKLALLDNSIQCNLNDNIQKEADRLLMVYLSEN